MHWWQNSYCSSSSPSSAPKSSVDDCVLNRTTRKIDIASLFSFRGTRSRERGLQERRLTRARKLRHLTDNEISIPGSDLGNNDLSLSPCTSDASSARPSSAISTPQPLPLPDLSPLLRREAASNVAKIPLPSPKDAPLPSPNDVPLHSIKVTPNKAGEERSEPLIGDINGDAATSNAGIARSSQDSRRNIEYSELHTPRKPTREPNDFERIHNNNIIHVSAPVSPFSVSALSTRPLPGELFTSSYVLPQANQNWSAPEFRQDMFLGLGSSYPITMDCSPHHSPRASPRKTTRSYTVPTSPLANRLSVDSSVQRRESNAQANVHPLPLPPGAAMPSQPIPPQVTVKQELMSVKGKWQKGKLIGRGTFGSVYVASNRETGALCAMKEVELLPDDTQSAESMRQLEQEIKVLSQLKHPNIVQYYGSEIVDDRFYIYLEYVHPGSINKYIRDHCGAMTESVVRNFTRHILSGLAYLHSTKTIHRDIKGANLLVDAYGVVKLADFGMAKHLSGQAAHLSLKGSPYWMAPELMQSVMQDDSNPDLALAVDIWSLGCTIIEMMNGKPPWSEFEGPAAMFKVLKETPPIPESMSPEGKDFLCRCFRRNPAERPTASMLLEHHFLKNMPQLDFSSSSTNALHRLKLSEKPRTQIERPGYRLEVPETILDAQRTRQKVANAFVHGGPFSAASLTNDLRT